MADSNYAAGKGTISLTGSGLNCRTLRYALAPNSSRDIRLSFDIAGSTAGAKWFTNVASLNSAKPRSADPTIGSRTLLPRHTSPVVPADTFLLFLCDFLRHSHRQRALVLHTSSDQCVQEGDRRRVRPAERWCLN